MLIHSRFHDCLKKKNSRFHEVELGLLCRHIGLLLGGRRFSILLDSDHSNVGVKPRETKEARCICHIVTHEIKEYLFLFILAV